MFGLHHIDTVSTVLFRSHLRMNKHAGRIEVAVRAFRAPSPDAGSRYVILRLEDYGSGEDAPPYRDVYLDRGQAEALVRSYDQVLRQAAPYGSSAMAIQNPFRSSFLGCLFLLRVLQYRAYRSELISTFEARISAGAQSLRHSLLNHRKSGSLLVLIEARPNTSEVRRLVISVNELAELREIISSSLTMM